MPLTPDEEKTLLNNIGPQETDCGEVYFPKEYVDLIRKIAKDAIEEYSSGKNNGRDGTGDALYLASCIVKTLAPELNKPLMEMYLALDELNRGQVVEILTPNLIDSRPVAPRAAQVTKAQIIAALEIHYKIHGNLKQSARWAYDYVKNWEISKTKKGFTAESLISWRKQAQEKDPVKQLCITYEKILSEIYSIHGSDKKALFKIAENMLNAPPLLGRKAEK